MKQAKRSSIRGRTTWGHQELACAVIHRALLDACNPSIPQRLRENARVFLDGSGECAQWCAVAGIDPDVVLQRMRALLAKTKETCKRSEVSLAMPGSMFHFSPRWGLD